MHGHGPGKQIPDSSRSARCHRRDPCRASRLDTARSRLMSSEDYNQRPAEIVAKRTDHKIARDLLPDEVLIRYRPYAGIEKWLKYRFSAWSHFKAWFVMTLVVLFFYFGGPGLIIQGIMVVT